MRVGVGEYPFTRAFVGLSGAWAVASDCIERIGCRDNPRVDVNSLAAQLVRMTGPVKFLAAVAHQWESKHASSRLRIVWSSSTMKTGAVPLTFQALLAFDELEFRFGGCPQKVNWGGPRFGPANVLSLLDRDGC